MSFDPNHRYRIEYALPGKKLGVLDRIKLFGRNVRYKTMQPLYEIANAYPYEFQSQWNPFKQLLAPRTVQFSGLDVDIYGGKFRLRTIFPDGTDHTDTSAAGRSVCGTGLTNHPYANIRRHAVTSERTMLEFLDDDGQWRAISLVQAFKYEVDIRKSQFPIVTITFMDRFMKVIREEQ